MLAVRVGSVMPPSPGKVKGYVNELRRLKFLQVDKSRVYGLRSGRTLLPRNRRKAAEELSRGLKEGILAALSSLLAASEGAAKEVTSCPSSLPLVAQCYVTKFKSHSVSRSGLN